MSDFVGLDVSLSAISICVMDEEGEIIARGKTPCDPSAVVDFIASHSRHVQRVVHETGQLSTWLHRELAELGVPIVCIDARMAKKALSARLNKTDRVDAEGLAQLARTGWYREVHVRSESRDVIRAMLGARDRLVRIRKDIEGHVRGVLKSYGIRLQTVTDARNRASFREQVRQLVVGNAALETIADALIAAHETVCAEFAVLDAAVNRMARANKVARRLMTIPGVGPVVALSFIATIDDADRFSKSTQVGAYLGLTPRRIQSGEVDYSGRISKCGNPAMRSLLVEAASTLIARVRRFSSLKAWAVRLAARKGFKKAAGATARKIAVIMHRIWRNETTFIWSKEGLAN